MSARVASAPRASARASTSARTSRASSSPARARDARGGARATRRRRVTSSRTRAVADARDARDGARDVDDEVERLVDGARTRDRAARRAREEEGARGASTALERGAATWLIQELKRVGRERGAKGARDVASGIFDAMTADDSEVWPNAHVCTTMMSLATRARDADKALATLEWMKRRSADAREVAPTTHTYTTCVQALDGAGRWEEALGMLGEMKRAGTARNAHTYSALVRAGANGGRAGARAVVKLIPEMKRDGVEPDLAIASALISAFGVLGSEDNARAMLRAIESSGRATDSKLYVDYMTAMCRCGNYEEAIETFTRVPRTTFTCTAVMKAYAEAMDWKLAEALFEDMRRDGPAPNDHTYSAMLHAYEKSLQWERAVRLLNQLTSEGKAKEIHHNIVLSVLGKCTQWQRAEVLFRDMRELYNIQPSRVTYSTLISAYGRSGKTDLARKVFEQMLARRIPPDDYTFVGLMLGPASEGNFRECSKIATEMKELYDVEHTVHTYNTLIQAADIAGNYDKAVEVYDELLQRGIEPNNTTRELVVAVSKRGANFYDRQQKTAAVASYAAGLVGVMGMALGRW